MRFVLWQHAHSPSSIVGSIEADSLHAAVAVARATWGSFTVVPWPDATADQRGEARRRDALADGAAELAHMT